MALELVKHDASRSRLRQTMWLLGLWVFWLIVLSAFSPPAWLDLTMTSIAIVFGTMLWTWLEAAWILLAMGWVFHSFSIFPPGAFWISAYFVFLGAQLALSQLPITNIRHIATAFFLVSLLLVVSQYLVLSRTYEQFSISLRLMGGFIVSAFIQAALGLLFAPQILAQDRHR